MKYVLSFAVIHFFFLISMLSLSHEKINLKNKKIYFSYLFTLILLILNFEFSISYIRVLLNVGVYIILSRMLITKNLKESILLGIVITLLAIISEFIYNIISLPMFKQNIFENEEVIIALINNIFIGLILFLLCRYTKFKDLYSFVLSTTNKIGEKQIIVFSLLIVIVFNFICWLSYFTFKDSLGYNYLTLISSLLSIFSALLVFSYFKINNKYLTVYEKYNISLESVKEFEIMIENYRINTHENKNQFRTIRNMCKNKKIMSYIDALLNEEINDDEKLLMNVQKIPAGGLRGIIYSKLLLIKEKEIPFELTVDKKITTQETEKIDDYTLTDVCRILGVLLDNSIEEVSKLSNKYILVELYEEGNDIVISVTNNYEGYVDVESINNPGISSKGDNHGYGLSLVDKLVNKNKKLHHESEFFEDNFMQKIKIKV